MSPWRTPLLPPITAGCWAGIREDCRPRTTWRPLTLASSLVFSQIPSHRKCAQRRYLPRRLRVPLPQKSVAHRQVPDPRRSAAACSWHALRTPSLWLPYNFADNLTPHEREDSKLVTSLQISVSELQNSEGFSPIHLLALQVLLFSETLARVVLRTYFSKFQRKLLEVHSGQVGLEKRFLMCQMSSVHQGCKQEARLSIRRGLGILTD